MSVRQIAPENIRLERPRWKYLPGGEVRRIDVLADAEQRAESSLSPEDRSDYSKLVVAGMAAALHNGVDGVWGNLGLSDDPLRDCALITAELAHGIAELEFAQAVTDETMRAAATTLLVGALNFAHRAGLVKVGPAELQRAEKILAAAMRPNETKATEKL